MRVDDVAEEQDPGGRSELWQALQALTNGLGVQRDDLSADLLTELQPLQRHWGIPLGSNTTIVRDLIEDRLHNCIKLVKAPKAIKPEVPVAIRDKLYRQVATVAFNVQGDPAHVAVRSMILKQRRRWLANPARGSFKVEVRTGQRYLNDAITQIEQQILASSDEPAEAEEPTALTSGDSVVLTPYQSLKISEVIVRAPYLNKLYEAILSGGEGYLSPICIWGEPGTGKTVLAHYFMRRLFDDQPVMPPVATLRAGDPAQLHDDMTSLLMLEGFEPSNWSDSYCKAVIRDRYSVTKAPPHVRAVIIDNVDNEGLIEQLVPDKPLVPFLVTMRKRPQNPRIVAVLLGNFFEEEALAFIKKTLPDADEVEARTLYRLFGGRPLALDHAVRFVHESPDITLRDVVQSLSQDLGSTLGLLVSPPEAERNLTNLYRIILEFLVKDAHVRSFLDRFLAITGTAGSTGREYCFSFLDSEHGGSWNRVRFRSAVRFLELRGLIREVSLEGESPAHSSLAMHPFTFALFRELRGAEALIPVESSYYLYLSSLELLAEPGSDRRIGSHQTWLVARTMNAVRAECLSTRWDTIYCVDEFTWIGILKQECAGNDERSRVIRYTVRPDAIYNLNPQAALWEVVASNEIIELYELARKFQIAMHEISNELLGEERPFDLPPSVRDGS